jgi:Kef-type K+ transport system membrane component KefB
VVHDEFTTFALIMGLAAVAGLVANRLRQPLIVALIAIGVLAGPAGLGWVSGGDELELLARLGIALLLFLVGLKLDVHLIRTTGPVALATGLGQVAFTSGIGFLIALGLGMSATTALYVAVALTFSSTIIIVKLLSDKRELDQLHGRIAVGFLVVQDIVVVLVMIVLSAFGGGPGESLASEVALVLAKGGAFLGGLFVFARYLLPPALNWAARSQELLSLFAVAWATALAAVSEHLGFSVEVGAFLAGVAVASTPYRDAAGARLVGLRDFLLLFFFLDLGARLEFSDAATQLGNAAVLSLFVLVGNPLIVLVIMGAMRYPARVSFLAGLTVAQISEFSLILATLGLALGHIDDSTVALITVVGLVTIGLSTYMILYSHQLFDRLAPVLRRFEARTTRPLPEDVGGGYDVIVYGLGRYGSHVVAALRRAGQRVLAVDFDPRVVSDQGPSATKGGTGDGTTEGGVVFGDAEDLDFLETLPLASAAWVVSAIPSAPASVALLHGLRHHGYQGRVALTALNEHDAQRYRDLGADVVLRPFAVAADATCDLLGLGDGAPAGGLSPPPDGPEPDPSPS